MNQNITEEDEGKRVVDHEGNEIGMISDVRGGTAYVDPDPGVTETVMSKLGWEDVEEEDYPLDETRIDTITHDEIHLERDL